MFLIGKKIRGVLIFMASWLVQWLSDLLSVLVVVN